MTVRLQPLTPSANVAKTGRIPQGHFLHGPTSHGIHRLNASALIDDRVVPEDILVHHLALTVDRAGMVTGDQISTRTPIAEAIVRDKHVVRKAQSKLKAKADGNRVVTKPMPVDPVSRRRQRSPATMRTRVPPADPGRPPSHFGIPHPTDARRAKPAPIMKGRPTPRVVGIPIPTAVGPQPSPAVHVGSPTDVPNRNRRPPATAIATHINPGAIG